MTSSASSQDREPLSKKLRFRRGVLWRSCRPSVPRHWLWLAAGLLWSGVGTALAITACYWLSQADWPVNLLGVLLGFGSGILVYRYGFSRIARRNIERISGKPESVCLFAFQAWQSYLLIAVMILLGYVLRHSSLPRPLLAVIYAAIGTGLTLSSSLYYARGL